MDFKQCNTCKENKPLTDFYPHKRNKDGYGYKCKTCIGIGSKLNYEKNKVEILKKQKEYTEKNRESIKQYSLNYYYDNKTRMNEYHKEYVNNTKETRNEYWKLYAKKRWENDDEYRISKLLRKHIYLFLTNQKTKKTEQTECMLGYSYQKFIETIGSPKSNEHVDHKIPITWFKKDTPPHIIWDLNNLQIVDASYNWSKNNRSHDEVNSEYLIKIKDYIVEKYLQILYPKLDA